MTTTEVSNWRSTMQPATPMGTFHPGLVNEPATTKYSWADQKDDEEEAADLAKKREGEQVIQDLKGRVEALTSDLQAKERRLQELEAQVIALQDFSRKSVTEARFEGLEKEVKELDARLNNQAGLSSTAPHADSFPASGGQESSSASLHQSNDEQPNKLEDEPVIISPSTSVPDQEEDSVSATGSTEEIVDLAESSSKNGTVNKTESPSPKDNSVADSSSTLLNEAHPSQTAPTSPKTKLAQQAPPPPAPVLKFPGQNKAKSKTAVATGQPTASTVEENGFFRVIPAAEGGGGWSAKSIAKDVRDMPRTERAELVKGPTVEIHVAGKVVRGVPKRMFMQMSKKAAEFFTNNRNSNFVQMDTEPASVSAIMHIVEYMKDIGNSVKVYSIPLFMDKFEQNVLVRQAAKKLDMDRYVSHFTKQLCEQIRQGNLSLRQMHQVVSCFATDDAVVECLANNLAHEHIKNGTEPTGEYKTFLDHHESFTKSVEITTQKIITGRQHRAAREQRLARQQNGSPARSVASNDTHSSAPRHVVKTYKSPPRKTSNASAKSESSLQSKTATSTPAPTQPEPVVPAPTNSGGNKKKVVRNGKVKGGAFGKAKLEG